jgi:hypothetical protein
MNEWLQEENDRPKKFRWWIIALILAVAGLAVLAWHFYSNGWSTGNQTKF